MTDTEVNDFLEVIDHDMAQMALDDKVIQNKQEAKDDNEVHVVSRMHSCRNCHLLCPDHNEVCAACRAIMNDDIEEP
ncbi:unnamed protein product [Acanthoscelides obtectus]|uniref:Uncharacterized protein n=1 Tax=Acanthoscelides obtectus TaxID=200917 RepID=A0A9P0QDJ6_ACAOB|nr:unnamed protein product [Acanthoscelides obtectus]CAH2016769.1 unnamed protein product [Acanthoscelides obtectus]CAH2017718.1 unnamed protein product [Acanthoscelides obtectus]CAH2017779.1 unnamed protein product [Acanthoscelides obtectus]CAH2017973.1 unnamed protein product [Acanthoscelides obtectus]